jgi:cell division protein FtsZ
MTLYEINEASSLIQSEAHEEANIIFGTVVDESMGDEIRITVIATGFDSMEFPKSNVTALGTVRRSNLSIPTFIRNDKPSETGSATPAAGGGEENPDLDIPTFLRRQAD